MKKKDTHALSVALAALLALAVPAVAAADRGSVGAQVSSTELRVGEPARFVVSVSGDDASDPRIPQVAGLRIEHLGQTRSISITNGQVAQSVEHVFVVVAERPGDYTIPAIRLGDSATEPVHVHASANGPAASAPNARSSSAPSRASDRAFVRVRVAPSEAVVGEAIPVRVRAYFRPGTSAAIGPPTFDNDAFLVEGLRDGVQGEETVRGEPYGTMTWTGTVTPLVEGEQDLAVDVPVQIEWRDVVEGRGPSPDDLIAQFFGGASPFGSSSLFGSGSFGPSLGPVRTAELTLEHTDRLSVVPLPAEGKPADFGGAVGNFTITSELDQSEIALGEPATMTVRVSGRGNFDRVVPAMLEDGDQLRAYAATNEMAPTGSDARTGTKTFRQSLVPTVAGELTLPATTLSFYDPARHAYETVSTEPLSLVVRPSENGETIARDLGEVAPADGLARTTRGAAAVASLLPLRRTRWIFAFPALVMALAIVLPIVLRRGVRAWAAREAERRARRAIHRYLGVAASAARSGDVRTFYASSRSALQERLARVFEMPAAAITLAEIESGLAEVPDDLRTVFERADALDYAGATPSEHDLALFTERVRALLRDLENRP